jgi:two-component system chemotaxis response regulator CheY
METARMTNASGVPWADPREENKIMSKTIMTVDDSASVRMMVAFTLKESGYNVIEAVNGIDALEKLESSDISLIIADINMPEMDGISMVKKIRGHKEHRFIPVIMLTTESHESIRERGREAGATGWIVKPFKPEQLLGVTRKVLG